MVRASNTLMEWTALFGYSFPSAFISLHIFAGLELNFPRKDLSGAKGSTFWPFQAAIFRLFLRRIQPACLEYWAKVQRLQVAV